MICEDIYISDRANPLKNTILGLLCFMQMKATLKFSCTYIDKQCE